MPARIVTWMPNSFTTARHTLAPFFAALATAGRVAAGLDRLREIGIAAERAMLDATDGVNTHRGAIFGLGLMAAAAGFRDANRHLRLTWLGRRQSMGTVR